MDRKLREEEQYYRKPCKSPWPAKSQAPLDAVLRQRVPRFRDTSASRVQPAISGLPVLDTAPPDSNKQMSDSTKREDIHNESQDLQQAQDDPSGLHVTKSCPSDGGKANKSVHLARNLQTCQQLI